MSTFKLRTDTHLSKRASSNLLLSLSLIKSLNDVTDTCIDFITGLSMIDQNATFSKEILAKVFKDKFPRLFIYTTLDNVKIKPFDFFFEKLQSNFYSKQGIIHKVDNNLYRVNNILPLLSDTTPHLSLYKVLIGYKELESYKGNMSRLSKDCSWLAIENLCAKTKGIVFNYGMIKQIFGLSRNDIKHYLKLTHSNVNYVFRTIGANEQKDLELDQNILGFRKKYRFIRGFTLNLREKFEHSLDIKFSNFALDTIKVRLEKEQYRFNASNFFAILQNQSLPIANQNECKFVEQYERLGFNCVSSAHSRYRLKRYIENVNLGSFKQMKNIYAHLKANYDVEKSPSNATFKGVYNTLLKKFIYQF